MKKLFILCSIILIQQTSFAQPGGSETSDPKIEKRIAAQVEKLVPAFKKQLSTMGLSNTEVAFALDTFRIERTAELQMEEDDSTLGMDIMNGNKAKAYDKLLNKYYNQLRALLNDDDKKILQKAQRAWLTFRDAEWGLIDMLRNPAYSGGGTIQTIIAGNFYVDLVKSRAVQIFNHYSEAMANKEQ